LIRQEKRIGMAKTFNQAIQQANGDIFVKTDCDSLTASQSSLRELVANFADSQVGGATGICAAKKGVEKYFRLVQTLLQVAETNIDSTIIGHSASLLAFRRSALTPVNPNSAAEDTEELILVRKNGYRTLIDTTVVSYEEVPEGFAARRTQKDRRAHGIIQAVIRNRDILFNKKYGKYGLIVFPQFLFILVLSPIFMLSAAIITTYIGYVAAPNLLLLALALIFLSYLAKPSLYSAVIDVQISGLVGTFRMLRGKNDPVWRKVR
jgi:cellulose synthase/poly-beta-1,6-N-acetylglucosamine synthase-like glycosyltransferase